MYSKFQIAVSRNCRLNTDQAVHVHWGLVRNYTACPKMIKTTWSNGTWIYSLIWVSLDCLRIRIECTKSGDWSASTSVTYDQWNVFQIILQKIITKNAVTCNKIHLSHVNAFMAKWNAAKCYIMCIFHDVKPACQQHRKQLGQGYILCWLWSSALSYIP